MIRILSIAFLAFAILFIASPVLQAQYTIEQTINAGYNPWIKGQSFTPNIGIQPNPGPVTTLDLAQVTFYYSGQGWSGPTSNFYLNIYDGDPVNGTGVFVGSSTNTVDIATLSNFDPITWTFSGLTLNYTQQYFALVSSTNTTGGFDCYCGMRESGQTDPYTGGTSIAGITGDPAGYHVKPTVDLAFKIDLTGVQKPFVDIKCNGGDSAVMVPAGTNVKIDYDVVSGSAAGTPVDIWIVLITPFGPFSYNGTGPVFGWNMGFGHVYSTGPLADVSGTALDHAVPLGSYKGHLGLDGVANGQLDLGAILLKDTVDFTVY
jgi:hypothetical protein